MGVKKSSVPNNGVKTKEIQKKQIIDLSKMIKEKANDIDFKQEEIESEEEEVIHPLILSDDKNDEQSKDENIISSPPQIEWSEECKGNEETLNDCSQETESETIQKHVETEQESEDDINEKAEDQIDEINQIINGNDQDAEIVNEEVVNEEPKNKTHENVAIISENDQNDEVLHKESKDHTVKLEDAMDQSAEIKDEKANDEPNESKEPKLIKKKSKHKRTNTNLEIFEQFNAESNEVPKPKEKKRKKNGTKKQKRKASYSLMSRISQFDKSSNGVSNAFNDTKPKKKKKKKKKKKVKKDENIQNVKNDKIEIEIEPGSASKPVEIVNHEQFEKSDALIGDDEIKENEVENVQNEEVKIQNGDVEDVKDKSDIIKEIDICDEDISKIKNPLLKKKVSSSSAHSLNSFSCDSEGVQSNEENKKSLQDNDEFELNHIRMSENKSSSCSTLSSLSPLSGDGNASFDDAKDTQNETEQKENEIEKKDNKEKN